MHSWHQINHDFQATDITALIEIPQGSQVKYEIDKTTGLISVDRVLTGAVHYPANYGFIPKTLCEDKDPLDILVLSQHSFVPMSIVRVRIIGALCMVDQGEKDDKIIAVLLKDPLFSHVQQLGDVSSLYLQQIVHFFEDYKTLEKKKVVIEKTVDQASALKIVQSSIQMYQKSE